MELNFHVCATQFEWVLKICASVLVLYHLNTHWSCNWLETRVCDLVHDLLACWVFPYLFRSTVDEVSGDKCERVVDYFRKNDIFINIPDLTIGFDYNLILFNAHSSIHAERSCSYTYEAVQNLLEHKFREHNTQPAHYWLSRAMTLTPDPVCFIHTPSAFTFTRPSLGGHQSFRPSLPSTTTGA